jgi:hypothetical protein
MAVQSSSAERARRPREPRPILPHAPTLCSRRSLSYRAVLPCPARASCTLVAAVVADALEWSREGRDAPRALARRAVEAELERGSACLGEADVAVASASVPGARKDLSRAQE